MVGIGGALLGLVLAKWAVVAGGGNMLPGSGEIYSRMESDPADSRAMLFTAYGDGDAHQLMNGDDRWR